jgi:trimeric autotransporter adhesin
MSINPENTTRINTMLFGRLSNAPPHSIFTIAGVGYRTGVPAREADAGWPMGVVRRSDGDLIVVDYHAHRLWRIDREGILHAFAGDGIPGNSGDGGPASTARFFGPHDLTQDWAGNLYLSDLGNQVIRRIDAATGVVTRVAGSGRIGRGGDGGSALEAELDTTCGVAVDAEGNLYLSSEWANTVRRVDAHTGVITTFAGQNAMPHLAASSGPNSGPGLSLMGFCGDGGPARAAAFHHPEHLAFDSRGDLYICDNSNDRIRKIDMRTGVITTVFGTGQRASNGDGGPAVAASTLMPDALCLDAHDNLYVGEKYGFRIRKVDAASGVVRTLVGNGVPGFGEEGLPGAQTHCNSVEAGIWADPDGTVFWSDCSGRLRRYDGHSGIVTTVLGGASVHDGEVATAGFLCGPGGLAVAPDGTVYLADVWNQRIRAIDPTAGLIRTVAGNGARAYGGDNGPATEAYLGNPHDVAVDSQGRVLIADTRNGRVRRIEPDGVIRVVAGTTLPWDAGEGRWDKGDHGPALSASFSQIEAVAVDAADNIYIGDAVGRIRKIDAGSGIITTVAGVGQSGYTGDGGPATQARIGAPTAIRFDARGNLYFSDRLFHVVRKIDGTGIITTVAGCGEAGFSPDGTPAKEAYLDLPYGLAVAPDGVIYVSDSRNNRVRMIGSDGLLRTVAGSDNPGDSGDGDQATAARLNEPHGLCLWGREILLVSDHYNNRVKAVCLRAS